METYLFKFSASLIVFWLVYILFFERHKMHHFKRFYLLGAITLSLIIPLLTITFYVDPINNDTTALQNFKPIESTPLNISPIASLLTLETMLWLIYSIGVLLFSIRFAINLSKMYRRISKNENVNKDLFIYVLLNECRIPHSFFKYLFFNKESYKENTIPEEVLLHEETHAKQLHSLDIIALELVQVVFWFHPLVYILKHHVKLNHEFLADQAVLEKGTDTKTYQSLLLQFSSSTYEYQLSSAINYSSIKKRFTVMKTQTSKTRIWASSLLLLPIIALLFYSFAERKYVEKEPILAKEVVSQNNNTNDIGPNTKVLAKQQKVTKKQIAAYNTWAEKIRSQRKKLSEDAIFYPPINENTLVTYSDIYKRMSPEQKNNSMEFPFPNLDVEQSKNSYTSNPQQKATKKQIAEYNAWARKMNVATKNAEASKSKRKEYPIIKKKDYDKYYNIYSNLMTEAQRENAEPWPNIPPPPPPPPAPEPPLVIKGGEQIPPPPPPPVPESSLDFVIRMAKKDAKFFSEGKAISSGEAISLIKKNNKLNINAKVKSKDGKPMVYITKKPIIIEVEGKSKN